jgi:hypothetical protein
MKPRSIMLIGGPDSGKTNYLARLWEALRGGGGRLRAAYVPENIKYVEEALTYLLQGKFAPRSDKNLEQSRRDFVIPVNHDGLSRPVEIIVPDVSGELWKSAVETWELPPDWMERLTVSNGALLFVRVLSDLNVAPLDWVTARRLLMLHQPDVAEADAIPTQVALCELFRFLELTLTGNGASNRPRVAVVVTAWDRLDNITSAAGPRAYLEQEYPLFASRLKDTEKVDVDVFGISVVGGDLDTDDEFRRRFFEGELRSAGYVVTEGDGNISREHDMTLPVDWLVEGMQKA